MTAAEIRTGPDDPTAAADPAGRRAASVDTWWGECSLPEGSEGHFLLGPLDLHVGHRSWGWVLAWRRTGDRRSPDLSVRCPTTDSVYPAEPDPTEPDDAFSRRSVLGASRDAGLVVTPQTAERLVVARPEEGCRVPAGHGVTLYVSTPLWLRLGTQDGQTLLDEPAVRLTDTWFGPSTRVGELAYAIRTRAFPDRGELPTLAFRAVTRIRVENSSHGDLEMVRIVLPAPELSLWLDAERPELGLWTSHVVLRRSFDGESAEVDVVRGAPPELGRPLRIAQPRQRQSRNVLVRAMSAILG